MALKDLNLLVFVPEWSLLLVLLYETNRIYCKWQWVTYKLGQKRPCSLFPLDISHCIVGYIESHSSRWVHRRVPGEPGLVEAMTKLGPKIYPSLWMFSEHKSLKACWPMMTLTLLQDRLSCFQDVRGRSWSIYAPWRGESQTRPPGPTSLLDHTGAFSQGPPAASAPALWSAQRSRIKGATVPTGADVRDGRWRGGVDPCKDSYTRFLSWAVGWGRLN